MIKSNISFKTILATLAVTVALVSCTKEITSGRVDTDPEAPVLEGSRVITVSFDTPTRTYLDTLRPKFKDGDSILLATRPEDIDSPLDTETVAVTVKEKKATITTKLSGNLIAFYPAKYVRIDKKPAFLFSAVQTGEFKDANLCEALIDADNQVAQFTNASALFNIDLPQGTTKLTIRSLPGIGDDGQRTGDVAPINNEGKSESYVITVGDGTKTFDKSYCYVSLMPGVQLRNLSFEASVDASTGFIKGIPVDEKLEAAMARDTVSNDDCIDKGWSYWIGDENWHEYVTIGNRKWATMNIGANSPQEAGEYFAWGGTTGYVQTRPDGDWYSFSPPDSTLLEGGFCWAKCPHTQGVYTDSLKRVFTKYTADDSQFASSGLADGKTILDLEDDAAYVKWGGAWRMPTQTEFSAMILKCQGEFNSGQYFGDNDSSPKIFLPAAGCGNGGNNPGNKTELRYWSSTLGPFNSRETAYSLFEDSEGQPTCCEYPERYYGYTIRAIIDEYVAIPDE